MSHALVSSLRTRRSALLAGALGLALAGALVTPAWAGAAEGSSVNAGRPCNGCVGNADDKAPPGQMLDGSDANAGYECDSNNGIGRGNPAHTACEDGGGIGVS